MFKSKSASWIAFSIGFSIASPQAAIAAAPGVDCATTSHPSCAAPQAPSKKKPARSPVSAIDKKIASYNRQLAEVDRKSKLLDAQIKKAHARTEKVTKEYAPYLERKESRQRAELLSKIEGELKIARLESELTAKQFEEQSAAVKQLEADIAAAREVRDSHAELLHARQAEVESALAASEKTREGIQARQAELVREIAETNARIAAAVAPVATVAEPVVAAPAPVVAPLAPEVRREIVILERKITEAQTVAQAVAHAHPTPSVSGVRLEVKQKRVMTGADLTADEAAIAFRGLSAKVDEKSKIVTFDALIFKSCEKVFIDNVQTEQVTEGSRIGKRFRDPGKKFLSCMESKKHLTCDAGFEGDECILLSEINKDEIKKYEEVVQLPQKITGPLELGVFTAKKDKLDDALDFSALHTYRTQAVIKADKNKEIRTKALEQRENYSCAVTDCVREGNLTEARKACKDLGKLSFLGALDPATKKEIAEEYAKCMGDIDEALLADLAASFQDEKDTKALLKKADQLVRIAKSNRKYANAIAEILLGKANALSNAPDSALPALAALNIPGVGTLGATSNPMIDTMRSLKVTEDRLEVARSLYKKGLTLGATKDWTALFNQKLTELDFTACGARAQALGITSPQVQACLNQNATVAQTLVQENCQTDQYSAQCMNAAMLYQGVQTTYSSAVQKTQDLAVQKQKQLLQNMSAQQAGAIGNGTGFLGLNALPGGLTPISPSTGMPGLQNLGLRNPGMNTIGSSAGSLPNVSFN